MTFHISSHKLYSNRSKSAALVIRSDKRPRFLFLSPYIARGLRRAIKIPCLAHVTTFAQYSFYIYICRTFHAQPRLSFSLLPSGFQLFLARIYRYICDDREIYRPEEGTLCVAPGPTDTHNARALLSLPVLNVQPCVLLMRGIFFSFFFYLLHARCDGLTCCDCFLILRLSRSCSGKVFGDRCIYR